MSRKLRALLLALALLVPTVEVVSFVVDPGVEAQQVARATKKRTTLWT